LAYGYRGYENSRPYVEFASQMLPYASEFKQWLADKNATAAKEQAQKQPFHGVPEFDPRWRQQIVRDPQTGELRPANGAPLDVVSKFTKYANWRQDWEDKFSQDPIGALKPGLEEFVRPLVQQAIQDSFQQYRGETFAQNFVQQNSDWLHQRDAQGNVLRDPVTGREVLTPIGAEFGRHVAELERAGIRDLSLQQQIARERVELQLRRMQAAQSPQAAAQKNEQAKQNLLQQGATRQSSRGGTLAAAASPSGTRQNGRNRLVDAALADLKAAGFTDDDAVIPN
jgi:hypothetical protein